MRLIFLLTGKPGRMISPKQAPGFVGVINDLHKGRDTGKVWSVVIDVAAILMSLVSLHRNGIASLYKTKTCSRANSSGIRFVFCIPDLCDLDKMSELI